MFRIKLLIVNYTRTGNFEVELCRFFVEKLIYILRTLKPKPDCNYKAENLDLDRYINFKVKLQSNENDICCSSKMNNALLHVLKFSMYSLLFDFVFS